MTMHVDSQTPKAKTSLIGTALAIAPAAVGCAAGLVLADRLETRTRQTLAGSLLTLGALATIPTLMRLTARATKKPSNKASLERRLEIIRSSDGPHDFTDAIIGGEEYFAA